MAQFAIKEVNQYYEKMDRSNIHNEDIFYKYFNNLVDTLFDIRNKMLSFELSVQTSIITDEIRENKDEIKKMIIKELQKSKEGLEDDNNKIKLETIIVNNFAGIKSKQKITFSRNTILCGEMGTGKSLICDFISKISRKNSIERWIHKKNYGNSSVDVFLLLKKN